ncbi:MAG: DUF302 domain-containing protein [Sulfitobacter sp.]
MIRTTLIATITSAAMSLPAFANDMINKVSPHSVSVTMDRLAAAVEGAGATVFARIDHAAGAAKVDTELRPTQVLIFGNPKLGTPAMLDAQTAGLDLPLRVLAHADAEGVVHVSYHAPASLADNHGLPGDAEYIKMMARALHNLTSKAVADD